MRPGRADRVDPVVFWISAGLALAFIAWGVLSTETVSDVASSVLDYLIRSFGWVFVLSTFGFLLFALYVAVSGFGQDPPRPRRRGARVPHRVLDRDDVQRRHGHRAHVRRRRRAAVAPRRAAVRAARPGTPEAARVAMEYSYFHWAFHPWALYAVVGLSLAYFVYRRGQRNLISSAFRPLLGDRVDGPIGRAIDILAIFATLFGSATSLGLGALQINSGMNFILGRAHLRRARRAHHRRAHARVHRVRRVRRLQGHPVAEQRGTWSWPGCCCCSC